MARSHKLIDFALIDLAATLVKEHPRAATSLAFQIGAWAGELLSSNNKRARIPNGLPSAVTEAALLLLASPSLQPSHDRNARRTPRRTADRAHRTRSPRRIPKDG